VNDFKDWLWDSLLFVAVIGFVINLIVGAI
jgi:hypothetical protein